MKVFIFLPLWILLSGSSHDNRSHELAHSTPQPADSLNRNILVINSFAAMSIKARNNKRDLFRELADSLKEYLAKSVIERTGYQPVLVPDILFKSADLDIQVFSLLKEKNADKAILIWSLDASFKETGSTQEIDNEDGKVRTVTSYDLCSSNEYRLYGRDTLLTQSTVESCKPFTTRSVKGRFNISFGPDIVGKKKHTYGIVAQNADDYISKIALDLK